MKKSSHLFRQCVRALAVAACSMTAFAAVVLGPSGTGVQTFGSLPPAQDWSTLALAGSAVDINTVEQLNAAIQQVNASNIAQQLGSASSVPPTSNSLARWNATGNFLQTRPTGNRATLLMARVQNQCGTNATGARIRFDFTVYDQLAGELPGFHVYISLSGNSGTWQSIPALSAVNASGLLSVTVPLFNVWTNGALLYVLWADDNAQNITDPGYTIDNFTVEAIVPGQPFSPSVVPAVAIRWISETGRVYQPQWTAGIPTNYWLPVGPYVAGTQPTNIVYDTPTNETRFYRVTVLK